ncbi:RNA polymerase small subunit, putative [Theileria annulata]|uniref:DNA-directed RNA polymerase subunit n=1 Tax=Theileria annulata TaxID=5874 RepID=Q4U9E5_THEAN|nr:RNA polymerase small subunit, putative [Theileria annulata]CAI76558.1 RNA polymerase small subunit, putative [Theileria annulata]|eukprot:XP_953183.1 RNA polymerase small subunit, putative [Theileria annulata]
MSLFCPLCHSILYFESKEYNNSSFSCLRCSYNLPVTKNYYKETVCTNVKEAGKTLFEANEFQHAPRIPAVCPSCNNKEAYFMSIQTRSADEPMTQFFVCTGCLKRWKE